MACYGQLAYRRLLSAGLIGEGRLGTSGRELPRITLPIRVVGNAITVSVAINGSPVTLLLDTGASITALTPAAADKTGVSPPPGAITRRVDGIGGRVLMLPVTRVRTLGLSEYAVEDLDVVILDALPHAQLVEGVLGYDVLRHFRVTLDREARQLVLEPVRQAAAAAAAAPVADAGPPVAVPSWSVGDEWQYRWESPQGSGTFVWRVEREDLLEGEPYWVIEGAGRELWYRKSDLALAQETVRGQVDYRARPPIPQLAWPLGVGKAWEQVYEHERPATRQTNNIVMRSHVEAAETVTVPAGTFTALKIVNRTRTGVVAVELWYAPEVGHWVRTRETLPTGVRLRELIAYRIQPPRAAR